MPVKSRLIVRRPIAPQPRCPQAWCRNQLVWDLKERIWRCPGCGYHDQRARG